MMSENIGKEAYLKRAQKTVRKPLFGIFLIIVLTMVFLIRVSTGPAEAKSQGGEDVIELKFAHHIPPGIDVAAVFEQWAGKVEEQTGGKVKVTLYPAESLSRAADFARSTTKGICDISFGPTVNDPNRFALTSVMELPMMGWSNYEMATKIKHDLNKKFPEIQDEFKGLKLLWDWVALDRSLHNRKKLVRTPKDLKGMKIITSGNTATVVRKLGASPVSLLPPDWYMALERGVAQGVVEPYNVLYVHKVHPLVKNHTDVSMGMLAFQVVMNLDKWNSLPPETQKAINDLSPWATQACIDLQRAQIDASKKACAKLGHTFVELTPEEVDLWKEGVKSAKEDWIERMETEGKPGKAVFEETQRLIKVYRD